jgi:DNA recombination protein RmuC
MTATLALLAGLAVGALGVWLVLRSVLAAKDVELGRLRDAERELAAASAEVEAERRARAEQERLAARAEDAFRALAAEALQRNNTSFLDLARTQLERFQAGAREDLDRRRQAVDELIKPIRDSLERVDGQVRQLEKAREHAFGALTQQLKSLADSQERLRAETGNLVTALRAPHVRGRWGEVQLRNVIELTGMLEHCDFVVQTTTRDGDGALLRPDVVVRLPGGKNVVVDAKVPLAAYLDACEAADGDLRARALGEHARQLRDHVTKLAAKAYWRQFDPSPDFVVMFLPDETFLRAAQEQDGAIAQDAWRLGVIPASPTNLFALLRTIAAIWQQQTVAESAREVHGLGKELYERLGTMAKYFAKLGKSLDSAVGAYNETLGSLESRVLVTARKLEAHGIAGEMAEPQPIERQSRPLQALELTTGAAAADSDQPAISHVADAA